MKKLIALSAVALLMAGCGGSKPKDTPKASLAPEPPPMSRNTTTPPSNTGPTFNDPGVPTGPATGQTVVDTGPVAPPTPAAGKKYVVQRGDTLWSIATRTYGDGKQYKKIVAANPSIKGDRIAVGQSIVLP